MKKGMTVMIYKDPLTRRKKEGAAKLVHKISERFFGEYKTELWNVQFPGRKYKDLRTVREDLRGGVELRMLKSDNRVRSFQTKQ